MLSKLAIITVHSGSLKKLYITLNSVNNQSIKPDLHLIVSKNYININNNINYRKFIFNKDKSLYNAMNILYGLCTVRLSRKVFFCLTGPYLTGRATIGRLELPPGEGRFVCEPPT